MMAAITTDHRLNGLNNNEKVVSHWSGSLKFMISVVKALLSGLQVALPGFSLLMYSS